MTSPTPRYKAIEDFLLERIHGGAYPVNHQIPPEEQLARDFGVSRMTVSRDGEVLIDVVDRKVSEGFDGFSLINGGGEWTLHELVVEDRN